MPRSVFGVPWDRLDLETLDAFLAEAEDEGLLWEAKGGGDPERRAIARAACGFANSEGGFLILGADREGGRWKLRGMTFPDEPGLWVGSIIRDRLDPVPEHDVKAWNLDGGRTAAVVSVEPVAVPPCLTSDGVAYQRVTGATVPIRDPRVLHALSEAGRAAYERAAAAASEGVRRLAELVAARGHFRFGVGIAAAGRPGVASRRLFRPETKEALRSIFVEHLRPGRYPAQFGGARVETKQRSLTAYNLPRQADARGWAISAEETGAVAAMCWAPEPDLGADLLVEEIIRPAWMAAARIAVKLGAVGRTAVMAEFGGALTVVHREEARELRHAVIARWTDEPTPVGDEMDSLRRELFRSAGFEEWEPEEGTLA